MAMKLLLRESVSNLGQIGDVVTVKDGYGRNFLIPRNLAVPVTPANIKALEGEKKRRLDEEAKAVETYKQLAERIQSTDITLHERVASEDKLYGAVSAKEIAAALKDEGIEIAEEAITMDEPIKSLGVHRLIVKLHSTVQAELKVWVVEQKAGAEEAPADA